MKVTILPPAGATPIILGDDPERNFISDFQRSQERTFEVAEPVRAKYKALFDRANRLNTRTYQVDRAHSSEAEAFKFAETHADLVPNQAHVKIEDAGSVRWLASALITTVVCRAHNGLTTVTTYTILSGESLSVQPAPVS